jgi:hypothetical protein
VRRAARGLLIALVWAVLAAFAAPARAGDPQLRWYTVSTPHFRFHFHGGLEPVAQRVAAISEAIHRRLVPMLGYQPTEITQVLITDTSEDANGFALALPYSAIRLFVSAPSDMSVLGDYDDWLVELVTHEYTHTLHLENIHGLPAILNAVLGKTYVPNQSQPRWLLEGLATFVESDQTSGGRLRSSQFEMFLRADVLEHNVATLDQLSHLPVRWLGGNLWYLYGSYFFEYVADLYGPAVFAEVASDYGQNIIPWGINRSLYRATGRTYPELYSSWVKQLEQRFHAQAAAVRKRGLREGAPLTTHGGIAHYPRFEPACDGSRKPAVVYYRDDGHGEPGYYRLEFDARSRPVGEPELVAFAVGGVASFDRKCGLVFESIAPSRRRYFLSDLFRQAPGTRSTRSARPGRRRLTRGLRAREPAVSPDGRRVAFVTNHAGTTTLRIAELEPDGLGSAMRTLVPSARYEQAYTPRFSPDGSRVTYSVWTAGGYRDIRVVDVATGAFFDVTHDRAIDQHPTFSPDGRYLLFASDRSGIPNIYAYELATKELFMVTNVVTGAYMPELAPDGRTLVYAGYTTRGFDLFALPFDPAKFLEAPPSRNARPSLREDLEGAPFAVAPYDPLPTLRPRAYSLSYGTGTFGNALAIATDGFDIVGYHAFSAAVTVQDEAVEPQFELDYVYRRLPFDMRLRLARSVAPRDDYRFGDQTPVVTEHATSFSSGLVFGIPGEFESQSAAVNYTVAYFDQRLPIAGLLDPFARLPQEPHRGLLGLVHLGYSYSNTSGTLFGVGGERGFALSLGTDFAGHEIGSESTLAAFTGRAVAYVPMPYSLHHVLALGLSGGAAAGTYPRRGLFFTGGFADTPAFDVFVDGTQQGAFLLRGYEPAQFVGNTFSLLNVEYRAPLLYVDRGVSTLPAYLRTVWMTLFFDAGGAFNRVDPDDPLASFHAGIGGELWFDVTLGYFTQANLRLGVAHGLDSLAPGLQTYWVASAGF